MRLSHALVVLAATALVPAVALACDGEGHKQAVKQIPLKEALALQKEKKATFVDANNSETRAKFGVVQGALLLSSFKDFDPAKELPKSKDQKLIFYCANLKCGASEKAAEKAAQAGYTDVNVMKEGIMGWKDAGAPVEMPRS